MAAGPVLIGHVNGLAPAGRVRQVFDTWRSALSLEEDRWQDTSYRTVFLHASARRNQVTVRLTATLFDEQPQAGL
jgi:hypothetical protein